MNCDEDYGDHNWNALVEWVSVLIVTRGVDRRCKLPAPGKALMALVCRGERTTLAKIAAASVSAGPPPMLTYTA